MTVFLAWRGYLRLFLAPGGGDSSVNGGDNGDNIDNYDTYDGDNYNYDDANGKRRKRSAAGSTSTR